MKHETLELYEKYKYALCLFSDQRYEIFNDDFEKFYEYYNMIIIYHWKIKPPYKIFNKRRNELIKKFNYGLYKMLLHEFFCNDISLIIVSFIIKV